MMRKISALLAEKGVTMSVNQWHSVMHADPGKTLRPEQNFRPMVDVEGNEAKLCVCPLCGEWQKYIARLYARYAELEPSILWVEGDFRLHNHEPLAWGGCFCDEHMKLYSARAGKPLTREEFLAGVLRPGEPHPYRKIWLDVSCETMLSAAGTIGQAVRAASKQAKVGLMSSAPHIHAAEGCDWHALLHTLAAGRPPVDRVHLPGYQENSPSNYLHGFNMVSMLTRAMLPSETGVYPELENFPFSLFSKSRRFTRFQLLSALPLDLAGITIDLYDLNGNGIVWEDGYQQMLHRTKSYLNALTRRGVFREERLGVRVLYSPCSSYTLHTREGSSMEELYPQEAFFAGLLPAMGVPYAYTGSTELTGQIVAASGQVLRNWDAGTLALRLPKRRMAGAHKVDYLRTLRAIGRNRHLLYSLAAQGCKGVREGAFTFILSIVLYQMVKNELLVGFNTFLSAAAAIASYVIASRILSLANWVRYMGIAVAVLTGIAALCILHLSPIMVILYTVINSFFAGFLENSTYSTFLDMMQLVPEVDDHRPELLAVNDTVLELGRCVGLSIIIVMNVYVGEDVGVQVWSLLVLTLTQVGTVLLCCGAMRSAKQAAPGA